MRTFITKGYGRVYTLKTTAEAINRIEEIIKEMDEFEFDYLPDDLITSIDEYPNLVHTGKFDDINIDELTIRCWKDGIPIWCYSQPSELGDTVHGRGEVTITARYHLRDQSTR